MPALPDLGIFLKGLTADGTCSKCKERVVHAQPKVYTVWESLEPRLVTWLRTVAKLKRHPRSEDQGTVHPRSESGGDRGLDDALIVETRKLVEQRLQSAAHSHRAENAPLGGHTATTHEVRAGSSVCSRAKRFNENVFSVLVEQGASGCPKCWTWQAF